MPPTTGTSPMPMQRGQQFTPPAPQQLPNGAGARAYPYLPARSFVPPVQPVSYYPPANPYAGYPMPAMPAQPMSVPSYWYQQW